jgi:hypothetical protein
MIDKKLATRIIAFLNDLLKYDREGLSKLFSTRVRCNKKLGEHPTVQTGLKGQAYRVGILGILNGLCGVDDRAWGGIVMTIDDKTGRIIKFGSPPSRFKSTNGSKKSGP